MKKSQPQKTVAKKSENKNSASKMIDGRIKELGDWRGRMLAQIRDLIKKTDSEVVEEWKWRGAPLIFI